MMLQAGTNPIIDIQIVDDSGLPVTGLVAASFPALSYVIAGTTAAVAVSLSDLALITTAYTSGGVKERNGGVYRFDLPAAAVANASTQVKVIGEAIGKRVLCPIIDVIAAPATHADAVALATGISALGSPMQASSYVAPTTPPTVVQIRQEMDANSTKLANCDVLTSTRLAASGYTVPPTVAAIQAGMATHADITALGSPMQASSYVAPTTPPTVVQIRQEMDANSTKLANCDVLTSTRLAASGYTVPPTVAAIQAGMATHADITALGSPMQASSYVAPPSAASIAMTTASVLFVDGFANPLKVNSDHSVNSVGTSGGTIANYITVPPDVAIASLTPGRIACVRGDTLRKALTTVGSVAARTKAWFTVKRKFNDPDSAALIQIIEGTGLVVYDGAVATNPALASLTIDNTTGVPMLVIDEALTAQFALWHAYWDIQVLLNGDLSSPIGGTMDVSPDVTRSTN